MKKYVGMIVPVAVLWLMGFLAKHPEVILIIGAFAIFVFIVIVAANRTKTGSTPPPENPKQGVHVDAPEIAETDRRSRSRSGQR